MEKESFFTGYCRQLDSARTVAVVTEDRTLTEVDCCYPDCSYQADCPIGKNIAALLEEK